MFCVVGPLQSLPGTHARHINRTIQFTFKEEFDSEAACRYHSFEALDNLLLLAETWSATCLNLLVSRHPLENNSFIIPLVAAVKSMNALAFQEVQPHT